jgi:hypothetical protein
MHAAVHTMGAGVCETPARVLTSAGPHSCQPLQTHLLASRSCMRRPPGSARCGTAMLLLKQKGAPCTRGAQGDGSH